MKDFDSWNEVKKKINERKRIDIKTGSIWLCNLGKNIGYEINGKDKGYLRPVLVLMGFGKGGGIILPLTTKNKYSKFLIKITKKSHVNLTQVRYLDSKRFYREVGLLNNTKFRFLILEFKKLFNEKK